jgi:putative tryptophan/tyrosine transport system substrate-binding protein
VRETQVIAQALGATRQLLEICDPSDCAQAVIARERERADALFVLIGPRTLRQRRRITAWAVKHQRPTTCEGRHQAVSGGLMSSEMDPRDVLRRSIYDVDRLLKGAKPADLPIAQPMNVDPVINLKTAQALGLTIPPTLLFQADEVIR